MYSPSSIVFIFYFLFLKQHLLLSRLTSTNQSYDYVCEKYYCYHPSLDAIMHRTVNLAFGCLPYLNNRNFDYITFFLYAGCSPNLGLIVCHAYWCVWLIQFSSRINMYNSYFKNFGSIFTV